MNSAVLILAGGSGIRLWPLSKRNKPKQFLPVLNNLSFFQATVLRALKLVEASDIYILTQKDYLEYVIAQAPQIPEENIFFESQKRNTAPAIITAMLKISKKSNDGISVVLPSDHFIADENSFLSTISKAITLAQKNNKIVSVGIPPTRPDIGFGYIKASEKIENDVFLAEGFKEKPDLNTALEFISDENCFWNCGIFVTKLSFMIDQYKKFLPDVFKIAEEICNSSCDEHYSLMPDISIDYGILEKTNDLLLIKGSFGWDDIGSWTAYDRLYSENKDSDGNISNGNCLLIDSKNCTIVSDNKIAVAAGVDDLFIINTPDAAFVFSKNAEEPIHNMLTAIADKGLENLL